MWIFVVFHATMVNDVLKFLVSEEEDGSKKKEAPFRGDEFPEWGCVVLTEYLIDCINCGI